ncbi:MAG: OmpA family protein [Pseudomonadota bacterium]|nr:OmpA family protein [Pseudomonadota bacterium]
MNTKLISAITLALGMAACASAPLTNPALESARSAVRTAESDPNVAKYAALDLHAARTELDAAEAAAVRRDAPGIAQPAYLAAQTARLAQLKASTKANDARVAAGQADRDKIQLSARTQEVDSAVLARNQATQNAASANAARDQLAQQAAALQAEVDALKAKPTDRGLVLTLGDVLFETGKADLSPGAARNLDQLVQFLTDHPERQVEIDGYTDSVGSDAFNMDLSQRRAAAVKMVLVRRGIDGSRIALQGFGKEFAVASNADSGGRQLNRRVEIVIGGVDGAAVAARNRT